MSTPSVNPNAPAENHGLHLGTSSLRFGRVLVGIDFSKQSLQALKLAISICEFFHSRLFLAHAAFPPTYGIGTDLVPFEVLDRDLVAARAEVATTIVNEPELSTLQPATMVAYDEPVKLIQHVASMQKVDLIVLGSHGATGLERLALGSVAEAVLHRASCPVLIVGPHCRAGGDLFRSIVFATDLETTGLRGAQYAASLAKEAQGSLMLLHVVCRRPEHGLPPHVIEQRIKRELQALIPSELSDTGKTKVRVEYGRPAEAIAAVAQAEGASLVVVGVRGRSALADHSPWSKLSRIIRCAKCPVLGVRGHLI
jgi:nucleotide-binding universal stress UspA family protein